MSIYDDPELLPDDDDYPPTLKCQVIGDRIKGRIKDVSKFTSRNGVAIKYQLVDVATLLAGKQASYPVGEVIAGSKNLKGQMLQLKPEAGDIIDIELTELRPSAYGNPTKIYRISVEGGNPFPAAPTQQSNIQTMARPAPTEAESDLFES